MWTITAVDGNSSGIQILFEKEGQALSKSYPASLSHINFRTGEPNPTRILVESLIDMEELRPMLVTGFDMTQLVGRQVEDAVINGEVPLSFRISKLKTEIEATESKLNRLKDKLETLNSGKE